MPFLLTRIHFNLTAPTTSGIAGKIGDQTADGKRKGKALAFSTELKAFPLQRSAGGSTAPIANLLGAVQDPSFVAGLIEIATSKVRGAHHKRSAPFAFRGLGNKRMRYTSRRPGKQVTIHALSPPDGRLVALTATPRTTTTATAN